MFLQPEQFPENHEKAYIRHKGHSENIDNTEGAHDKGHFLVDSETDHQRGQINARASQQQSDFVANPIVDTVDISKNNSENKKRTD